MEAARNKSAKKTYFVPLVTILSLIIIVLVFLLSPLKNLVFSPDVEPTLVLTVVESTGPETSSGLFRVVVEAQVDGKPEPQITFNRNDGIGIMESTNHTLLLMEEGEAFLLKAMASNSRGTAEAELEIFAGVQAYLQLCNCRFCYTRRQAACLEFADF